MEVKEFVKKILKDITEAVKESNNEKHHFYIPEEKEDGIDFDLAVVSKKEGKGKVGAIVLSGEGKVSNEVVNRIKFRVRTYRIGK